jgi:coatomer subunit delta
MPRLRIEGLLAAFPKLISSSKQQHTFVETDTVRYIYQPLENSMYLLLITTKSSNIVEDLGTLRLLAKVVPDVAGGLSETAINSNAFELIFSFDEVITTGGYREDISLSEIRKNLQMESHEEQVFIMLENKKKEDAKRAMDERAAQIKKRQMEALKDNLMGNAPSAPIGGMVGIGGGGVTPGYEHNSTASGYGGGVDSFASYQKPTPTEPIETGPRVVAKGMKLGGIGGDKKKTNLMAAMAMEDNFSLMSGGTAAAAAKKDAGGLGLGFTAAPVAAPPSTPLTVALEEKYTVAMNREGGIDSCELKGTLTLTANTDAGSAASLAINKSVIASKCTSNWNFATHPKVDKTPYEKQGIISLKGGKGLPVGRPVSVLRWSYSGEDAAPISINCWPDDDGTGSINVNVEFELLRTDMVLTDVNILLPLGTTDAPSIESIDGQYKHDANNGLLCWHHDIVDSGNSSGSIEFSIAGDDVDSFFPVQVMFKSQSFMCPIEITGVTSAATGAPIPNGMTKSVVPESYTIA